MSTVHQASNVTKVSGIQEEAPVQRSTAKLSMAFLWVAFAALFLGAVAGLLQTLSRNDIIQLPWGINYYQLLTAHGVLLALIFTTYFIFGFIYAGLGKATGPLTKKTLRLGWLGFTSMSLGTALGVVMILLNEATVLYTFYAPLQASPWYYIALALIIIGSWFCGAAVVAQYVYWRREHQGKLSPLFSFMAVVTLLMWFVATLGVTAAVVFQFIPWSFGWVETINVVLTRTLFWYFGHPLVYFWLLPAYMSWYVIIPKIVGGKIFSDALSRVSFILLFLFAIPVGFHHQLLEPGIAPFWKYLQVVLTFMVVVPSLMTAFSMFATFELAGRAKGAQGRFGWLKKLPWGDARFFAPMVGMLMFIPAGAGGLINASYQLNQVVHNTLWVVGHFHLTLGTSVVLTFFGAAYWLVPYLTGRTRTKALNRLGIIQTIIWTVGMLFMSAAMHTSGLLGAPRRTGYTTYGDHAVALGWIPYKTAMALGGALLFLAIILFIYIMIRSAFFAPKGQEEFPMAEVSEQAEATPKFLENWKIWITISAILILIAYVTPVINMIQHAPPGSEGFRFW